MSWVFRPSLRSTALMAMSLLAAACHSPTDARERPTPIAYVSEAGGRFWQWHLSSTDGKRRIPHPWLTPDVRHAAWSADGQWVAYTAGEPANVYIARADGSQRVRLTNGPNTSQIAAWAPDGTRVAYWSNADPRNADLVVAAVDGSSHYRPAGGVDAVPPLSWSPDGSRIVFTRRETRPNPNGTDYVGTGSLMVLDVASGTASRLTTAECGDVQPVWSPDGSSIVFTRCADSGGRNLYRISPDGSGLRRLTTGSWEDGYPSWSPDGREIAFESNRAGNFDVWVMRADGTRPRNLTADSRSADFQPTWLPDPPR